MTGSILQAHQAKAAIALGSNLGNSRAILTAAIIELNQLAHIQVLAQSSCYQTAAVGPPQPDYLNQCIILATALSPQQLLEQLLSVETYFGRVRRERWGPRRLDLDLLLFEDRILSEPMLTIPHPRMAERAFVLVPLAEIAADWIDPVSGKSIETLLQQVDCSGIQPYCCTRSRLI